MSGPLLDRIDIQVGIGAVPLHDFDAIAKGEPSAAIRERVTRARAIQSERYRGHSGVVTNAEARSRDLKEICLLTPEANAEVRRAIDNLCLSARAYDRILRVSRTIADLAGRVSVERDDVREAVSYRQLDTESGESFWA